MPIIRFLWILIMVFPLSSICFDGGAPCSTPLDCGMGGLCVNKTCSCFPTFTSPNCTVLHLLPAITGVALNRFDSSSWGGSVAYSHTNGTWHMFFADMLEHCGLGSWECNSAISHAVANHPEGPYVKVDTILAPFAHNPTLHVTPQGEWVVFHIGQGVEYKPLMHCSGGVSNSTCGKHKIHNAISSELDKDVNNVHDYLLKWRDADPDPGFPNALYSKSPNGPWEKLKGSSIWALNNPSAYIFENGTTLMIYKVGCNSSISPDPTKFCRQFAVATAPSWRGPFRFRRRLEVFGEDAYIWHGNNGFHMLFQGGGYTPALPHWVGHWHTAWSPDPNGIAKWTVAGHTPAFNNSIKLQNGSIVTFHRRERHQILFNQVGKPAFLFNGVTSGRGDYSLTSVQPINI